MKRKESEIELQKEWASPRSNVQLFVPQDYCAQCNDRISDLERTGDGGTVTFLDLSYDGIEQRSTERFYNQSLSGAIDGVYPNVKAYYLQRLMNNKWENSNVQVDGGKYEEEFVYYKNTYRFRLIGTYDIKIDNKVAYHNAS